MTYYCVCHGKTATNRIKTDPMEEARAKTAQKLGYLNTRNTRSLGTWFCPVTLEKCKVSRST